MMSGDVVRKSVLYHHHGFGSVSIIAMDKGMRQVTEPMKFKWINITNIKRHQMRDMRYSMFTERWDWKDMFEGDSKYCDETD